MEQVGRRTMYLVLGVVPSYLGVALCFIVFPILPLAAAGALGLTIATIMRFPLSEKIHLKVLALLACGLVVAIPFGIMILSLVFGSGVPDGEWLGAALWVWLFGGPIWCAGHFMFHGDRYT